MKQTQQNYCLLILNQGISILFVVSDQIINDNTQNTLIMDIICLICAMFFSLIFITKYLNWNFVDISPLFYWVIILKRIYFFGMDQNEFAIFLIGLLNGIYISKQLITDQKFYYLKSKSTLESVAFLIFLGLNFTQINQQFNSALFVVLLFLIILVLILENIRTHNNNQQQEIECNNDLKNTQLSDVNGKNQKNTQQTEIKKQQTIIRQRINLWEQYYQQNDDWICKIEIIKNQFTESLENSEQNYNLKKSLFDFKFNLQQLFNNIIVTNSKTNIHQSIQFWSDVTESLSLIEWLKQNYFSENSAAAGRMEIRKKKESKIQFEGLSGIQEDQVSIYSPQNDIKGLFSNKEFIHEISAIPQNNDLMNSGSTQIGKVTLTCQMNLNQILSEYTIVLSIQDDECEDGQRRSYLILSIRNNEKLVKLRQIAEKHEQQSQIFFKFIGRMATNLQTILHQLTQAKNNYQQHQQELDKLRQINFISYSFCGDEMQLVKSEKQINETNSKLSNHLNVPIQQTQNYKITSSNNHNTESQEKQKDLPKFQVEYTKHHQDLFKVIQKLEHIVLMSQQHNFNIVELFSYFPMKEERFTLLTTINAVKEFFKFNEILIQQNVQIITEIENEQYLEIIADKRKIKTVLINLVSNSLENYAKQLSNKQNIIKIKAIGSKEKVNFEIMDIGGGIQQEQLKLRFTDCKLGLAACKKILFAVGNDQKKPLEIINYINSQGQIGIKVLFSIPAEPLPQQVQPDDQNKWFDTGIISNMVEN